MCGKDVAAVLPTEAFDLENLPRRQVADLCPDVARGIDPHEHSFR
jgi:hypothetical protein